MLYETDSYLRGLRNGVRRATVRYRVRKHRGYIAAFILGAMIGALAITEVYSFVR